MLRKSTKSNPILTEEQGQEVLDCKVQGCMVPLEFQAQGAQEAHGGLGHHGAHGVQVALKDLLGPAKKHIKIRKTAMVEQLKGQKQSSISIFLYGHKQYILDLPSFLKSILLRHVKFIKINSTSKELKHFLYFYFIQTIPLSLGNSYFYQYFSSSSWKLVKYQILFL